MGKKGRGTYLSDVALSLGGEGFSIEGMRLNVDSCIHLK